MTPRLKDCSLSHASAYPDFLPSFYIQSDTVTVLHDAVFISLYMLRSVELSNVKMKFFPTHSYGKFSAKALGRMVCSAKRVIRIYVVVIARAKETDIFALTRDVF